MHVPVVDDLGLAHGAFVFSGNRYTRFWRAGAVYGLTAAVALVLACGDTPTEPPPPPPPAPTLTFDIEVRYVAGTVPTAEQRQAIDDAVAIWESVIVGDLPAQQVKRPGGLCERVAAPAMDESVDDLVVWIEFAAIDGFRGVAAWGGVCELRNSFLPAVGSVLFDEADLAFLGLGLAIHELGHALGFGEVWDEMGLLVDPSNPANGGPGFVRASSDATISSDQPDQNFGVPSGAPISDLLVAGTGMGVWTSGPADEELQALFEFDVSGLSFTAPIDRSAVIIWDSATSGVNRPVDLSEVIEPWDETSVTWNSQPATGPSLAGILIPPGGCVDGCAVMAGLDIRDLVMDWILGVKPNHGFMLSVQFPGIPDFGAAFHSRHDPDNSKQPALYIEPRSHFAGMSAVGAYDAAGGASSTYPKVPVENRYISEGESVDGHWHPSVLGSDYMAPQFGTKMSAITIGAMEDMGYEVDFSVADPLTIDPSLLEP